MAITAVYIARCDGKNCQNQLEPTDTKEQAEKSALEAGWTLVKDLAFCSRACRDGVCMKCLGKGCKTVCAAWF